MGVINLFTTKAKMNILAFLLNGFWLEFWLISSIFNHQ